MARIGTAALVDQINERREKLDGQLAECRTRKERSAINKELWRLDQLAEGLRAMEDRPSRLRNWRQRRSDR